jgi:hypothetical protein
LNTVVIASPLLTVVGVNRIVNTHRHHEASASIGGVEIDGCIGTDTQRDDGSGKQDPPYD